PPYLFCVLPSHNQQFILPLPDEYYFKTKHIFNDFDRSSIIRVIKLSTQWIAYVFIKSRGVILF
ncbi:MAG: hypothetical protein OQK04_09615, partial [Kangiellaceae bacterium]|nr:hypothetical protein [Kangiellaceae bacterium]